MVVKLRLARMGRKKSPIYKIVAADSQSPRDGRYIESIGQYNPLTQPMTVDVKEDKMFKWLKNGAQPTDTVRSLFRRKGLWLKWSLIRKGKSEEEISPIMEQWQQLQVEKLSREAEKKARRKAKKKSEKTQATESSTAS
ncbi:MAG: 30S ribosomal protein S16 [Ignavibacteria bacterium]|nr:30S ribosomal protein S16 [Ignavibacteria bacterium]